MTLVPLTGVLELVAKVESESPQAARQLAIHALYGSLCEQVDELRPTLEPALLEQVAKIADDARQALVRYGVSKAVTDGVLAGEEQAQQLDLLEDYVEKGLIGWLRQKFERQHPRDNRGRFIRIDVAGQDANAGRDTKQAVAHTEGSQHIARLKASGMVDDDTKIGLHYSRMAQGDARGKLGTEAGKPKVTSLKDAPTLMGAAAEDEVLTGISVARGALKLGPKQQGGLDLIGLMSGQDELGSKRIMDRLGKVPKPDAGKWNAPSQGGPEMDRQAYRRLQMTGQTLATLAAPGSTASVVGGMAQLVGEIGPEAEKVLSPGIRRAAYRYRGTERRADRALFQQVGEANKFLSGRGDYDQRAGSNPAADIATHHEGSAHTDDMRAMLTRGDVVAAYMLGAIGNKPMIPTQELSDLSMASGEVPPSQGVMIDADGRIVAQAVGFNGDHYLPFDLRNLGYLHGGQYVRTRATGGPTSEDIYTALMTGTRQVQVVSRSGVFTMEFDPELRGGRRYNDKARRMVTRYQEMLEAINNRSGNLYERPLPASKLRELRQTAIDTNPANEAQFKEVFDALVERELVRGSMVSDDDADEGLAAATSAADTRIAREYAGVSRNEMPSDQMKARIRAEMIQEELTRQGGGGVRRLQLDGAGYDRAMKALQQEFPYFIRRADWKPLNDWLRQRNLRNEHAFSRVGAKDRGFIERGQTNPTLGRVGANARRTVPGLRSAQAPAPDAAATAGAPAATPTTTSTPTAAPAGAQAKATPLDAAALTKEGSGYMRAMTLALQPVVSTAASIVPPGNRVANDDDPLNHSALQYFNWHANRIDKSAPPGDEGKVMAKWLIGLNPKERNIALKGFRELAEYLDGSDAADEAPAAEQAFLTTVNLLDLLEPFEKPGTDDAGNAEDPVLHRPSEAHPRPVAFADQPGVDTDPVELDSLIKRKAAMDPVMDKAVQELAGLSNNDRADRLVIALDSYGEMKDIGDATRLHGKLEAMQRAWSLLHTKETAERLAKVMGGGAGPKAPPVGFGKSARPRRVIVHKVDDPFSRRTRAMLGIPEPSAKAPAPAI